MKSLTITLLFFVGLLWVRESDALKILVVSPIFGRSHMLFMGKLADLYVENGHDVVFFEPEIIDDDPILNVTSSKLARVIKKRKDWLGENAFASFQQQGWTLGSDSVLDTFKSIKEFVSALGKSCRSIMHDEKLLNRLRAEKFDIAVAEYLSICPYGIYKKIGVSKYITASATPIGASFGGIFGVPTLNNLAFTPEFFSACPVKMTFWERLENFVGYIVGDFLFSRLFVENLITIIQAEYPDFRIENALAESSYLFINANEHVDFARTTSHKFINIAGIGLPKPKPLEEDYRHILDESNTGVVLMSYGSIAKSYLMPNETKRAFLESFAEFPDVTFLWKYEKSTDNVAHGYQNVVTREWVPQVDLFGHKNLIGFITHGGMNSLIEASIHGVPSICIPLFDDQNRNCRMTESRDLGIMVQKTDLTKETITAALHELIRNKRYLTHAREISRMIKKKPMSPKQSVLKYTEFAAEFDVATNLDSYGRHLTTVQFYNADVLAFLFAIFIALIILCVTVTVYCLKRVLRRSSSKDKAE